MTSTVGPPSCFNSLSAWWAEAGSVKRKTTMFSVQSIATLNCS
ncbi:hypothetical protein [Streptomyces sp. NPDC051219]